MNFRAMATMRAAFNAPVGCPTTASVSIGVAAVGPGASTWRSTSRSMDALAPTICSPSSPANGQMVRQIREVEAALGDGLKLGPAPEELEMHTKARRSLIAARDIPKGTAIDRSMIAIKRPGFGIRPKLIDLVVGRVARVDIAEDAVLTWDLL
jgi:N-acetylneuraminate synthase/N,N'-diacetyllegionaminate synthase